jgi:hypothetical protein
MPDLSASIHSFLRELRRRRVAKTSLVYVLVCWGGLEVADLLIPALGVDAEPISRWLSVLGIAGFPAAIAISWFYQITPEGVVKTRAFVDRRVLTNMPPINDRRHDTVAAYFREEDENATIHWYITVESGALVGLSYGVTGELVFGRALDCDLTLPSSGISRHHARLFIEQENLKIQDLDSANGCLVNGRRVEGVRELEHGDEFLLQDNLFRVSENFAWNDDRAAALNQTTYIKPPDTQGTL